MEIIERFKAVAVARDPYVFVSCAFFIEMPVSSRLNQPPRLAGAGKTFIASTVIDSLCSSPAPEKLAYFYCNRAEENRREPQSILNTLIQQLAQTESKEDQLLKPVIDIYLDRERKGQRSSRLSLGESEELLVKLADIYPQTTICIDALDEVETNTRIHLLKALKNIIEKSKTLVKIFVTTRMDPDILRQFEMFPRIELEPDDNIGDINQFVETKLQNTIDDGRLLEGDVPSELKAEIYDVLCRRSRGMYTATHQDCIRAQLLMDELQVPASRTSDRLYLHDVDPE